MTEKKSFLSLAVRLALGLIGVLVALWVLFNVIIPTVMFLIKIIIVLAVLGGIVWLVVKVLHYDPDKAKTKA